MTPRPGMLRSTRRLVVGIVLVASVAGTTAAGPAVAAAVAPARVALSAGADVRGHDWDWPAWPARVERPFIAPPHAYGAGHRGVDLRPLDGDLVVAPAPGVVAFSGPVAGRGILTIDHGDGLVTTLEPIDSDLAAGTPVGRGDVVGTVSRGGHAEPGTFHFGVRLDGEYINPLLLLGGVPRAILLPCC